MRVVLLGSRLCSVFLPFPRPPTSSSGYRAYLGSGHELPVISRFFPYLVSQLSLPCSHVLMFGQLVLRYPDSPIFLGLTRGSMKSGKVDPRIWLQDPVVSQLSLLESILGTSLRPLESDDGLRSPNLIFWLFYSSC